MKGDRDVCIAAVAQDGEALQYCSTELQKDIKISTIAAVRRNGRALKDVPEEIKVDRDVCIAFVAQDPHTLQHVQKEVKNNEAFALFAVNTYLTKHPGVRGDTNQRFWREFMPDEMQQNERVRRAYGA